MSSAPLLHIAGLQKDYRALRPLRIAQLLVRPGDVLSIGGLDAPAAETFVHLVTGATLPDAGDILLFGGNTRAIEDSAAWLKSLDGVGMITSRGILIEMFSVLQNVAMSLTLDVDPIDPRILPQAGALAREAGIADEHFDVPAGKVPAEIKMRVHVARAMALEPKIVIGEHPSVALPREAVPAFGADLARVARGRGVALVVLTADEVLAKAVGGQRLELVAATGELRSPGLLRKLFG